MARTNGTYSLSSNFELEAGAPLDARERVATKADLTASGTFPYPWVGMETYVVSEGKKYQLIGSDPTVLSNWVEIGHNVRADWSESDSTAEDYILNKPTKLSDFTDDVVNGNYLPLTGGTLTGNLNVSGSSDTSLYTHGNASGSHIGFRNQAGNITFGYIGVKNDNLPYFYGSSSKRIALLDEVPAAQVNSDWNASSGVAQILNKPSLATVATSGSYNDLSNKPNRAGSSSDGGDATRALKVKDAYNSNNTTFAYSQTELNYDAFTWLAAWNGYELRATNKSIFAQNYVEGRLSNGDSYTSLAHGYYGGSVGTYWRIAFPDNTVTIWNMINMTVSVRQNWNPPIGGKIMIHTYHNATSPYTWQGLKAEVIGSLTSDIKVYGSDGKYIYIGGCHAYTTLLIDDLLIGDSARARDFKGTTVDMVSALPACVFCTEFSTLSSAETEDASPFRRFQISDL